MYREVGGVFIASGMSTSGAPRRLGPALSGPWAGSVLFSCVSTSWARAFPISSVEGEEAEATGDVHKVGTC